VSGVTGQEMHLSYPDDKAPTDATTVQEALDLYRTARPPPAGS
jgi:hypothetical protein